MVSTEIRPSLNPARETLAYRDTRRAPSVFDESDAGGNGVLSVLCRVFRAFRRLTRTRLVRLFKKGDRPLCPLKIHSGRSRDCGLGTEWSVPFFEARMRLAPVGKTARKPGSALSLSLFAFRQPGTEAVCSVL